MKNMKRTWILMLMAMSLLQAGAQVSQQDLETVQKKAQEAQEAARKAAEAASTGRQNAQQTVSEAEERNKNARPQSKEERERERRRYTVTDEDLNSIRRAEEEQQQMIKLRKVFGGDSVKLTLNQIKMELWRKNWFVGAQLGPNFLVADNITDHSPLRSGDAWGYGFDLSVGKFLSRTTALRLTMGYQKMANRVDRETVEGWEYVKVYNGSGYYRFDVFESFFDIMFDVSGLSSVPVFRPLHVFTSFGVGVMTTGRKKLIDGFHGDYTIEVNKDGREVIKTKYGQPPTFGMRVKQKPTTCMAIRFCLMFDYQFQKNLSANCEMGFHLTTSDWIDGINYAEPFDIPLKLSLGMTRYF